MSEIMSLCKHSWLSENLANSQIRTRNLLSKVFFSTVYSFFFFFFFTNTGKDRYNNNIIFNEKIEKYLPFFKWFFDMLWPLFWTLHEHQGCQQPIHFYDGKENYSCIGKICYPGNCARSWTQITSRVDDILVLAPDVPGLHPGGVGIFCSP